MLISIYLLDIVYHCLKYDWLTYNYVNEKMLFFQFFNGPGHLASQIQKYCSGNVNNLPVRSSENEAYVLYKYFNMDVDVTFELKISSVICIMNPLFAN